MENLSGQIPLVPQTMELDDSPFLDQAVLSLQHLWRVGQERKVDLWAWGIAFIASGDFSLRCAQTAISVWQKAHTSPTRPVKEGEEDDIDPWDAQRNFNFTSQHNGMMTGQGDHLHILPSLDVFGNGMPGQLAPPCIVAEVLTLPREAPIEWWSTGLANLPKTGPRVASGGVIGNEINTNVMAVHSLKYLGQADGEGRMDNDGAHFVTLVLLDCDGGSKLLREWVDRMFAPRHEDENPKRRVVSGTCFVAELRGRDALEDVVNRDWMSGIPIISCRSLFVDDVGRKNCASDVRKAILVLLLRTEEVEPKQLEKEHGRQT
jgi:hypothetical protein